MAAVNNSTNCFALVSGDGSVVLELAYCVTFINILNVNIVLFWLLTFRMNKIRSNILSIFPSLSDIFVALIPVPLYALPMFKPDLMGCWILCGVITASNNLI